MNRRGGLGYLVLGMLGLLACSKSAELGSTYVKTGVIGPAGGTITVESADVAGTPAANKDLVGTSITIPAGALSASTTIQIGLSSSVSIAPTGGTPDSPVVEFEPSGTTFAVPVTIQLPVTKTTTLPQLIEVAEADGSSQRLVASSVANGLSTFQAAGFSLFQGFTMAAANIMLVVDRSGSMTDGADGMTPGACANASGDYSGDRSQDCKWNNLLDVLLGAGNAGFTADAGFLGALVSSPVGPQLAIGLTQLPGVSSANPSSIAYSCFAGTTSTLVPFGLGDEGAVATSLVAIEPGGGTPTAATLQIVKAAFASAPTSALNYVILLTDGAPNCDSSFPSPSGTNCAGDRCTLGEEPAPANCPPSEFGEAGCECSPNGTVIPEGCLDENASVSAVSSLYSAGIQTFVIGFGAATISADTIQTLNEMGMAGGTLADSQGNYFFQANSTSDLQAALQAILGQIQ